MHVASQHECYCNVNMYRCAVYDAVSALFAVTCTIVCALFALYGFGMAHTHVRGVCLLLYRSLCLCVLLIYVSVFDVLGFKRLAWQTIRLCWLYVVLVLYLLLCLVWFVFNGLVYVCIVLSMQLMLQHNGVVHVVLLYMLCCVCIIVHTCYCNCGCVVYAFDIATRVVAGFVCLLWTCCNKCVFPFLRGTLCVVL